MLEKFIALSGLVAMQMLTTIVVSQLEHLTLINVCDIPSVILPTMFHALVYGCLLVLSRCRLISVTGVGKVPVNEMLQVSAPYALMYILECLSYEVNTMGAYELYKVFLLPCLLLFNYSLSLAIKLVLVRVIVVTRL